MFKFSYKVATEDRRIRDGHVWAFSAAHASKLCASKSDTVIAVYRERSGFDLKSILKTSFGGFSKIERIHFFRNLSSMIGAGLSVVEALGVLQDLAKGHNIKRMVGNVAKDIENGIPLSKAISKYPRYFPSYITDTVHLGEVSGTLTETLERISLDLEKDYELSRKVIQVLAYPLIIVTALIALLVVLIIFVMPQIVNMYNELEVDLPLVTQVLVSSGNFVTNNPLIVIAISIAFIALIILAFKFKYTRYILHYMMLKIPFIKGVFKEINLVRFFRAFNTLVASGMSWIDGIEIAKKTLSNDVYRSAADTIQPILYHGGSLSEALAPFPDLFPPQTVKILSVGEKSGRFEETLGSVSAHHERSLDHLTKILTTLIEPILLLVIGVIVGGLALSIFLPIYNVTNIIN